MLVLINGESRDVADSITLVELVNHLALAHERLAIELNQKVVRRADWQQTIIHEGDRVEIVHFVGGGVKDSDK
ncbi:MAG: sulfur carrier protein ThiS [Acidobacteria bacterium]|nr:sulfur carrier protein ThiS [Acidobacteriota bacterium]